MKAFLIPILAALVALGSPAWSQQAKSKTAPGSRPHVLQGLWKIYWLDQNKQTEMRIVEVFPGKGTTNLVGAMALMSGVVCPMTGSVSDTMTGEVVDGLEKRIVTTSAFVTLKAQCPDRQLWVEAFGLPSGPYLMNGRATQIDKADRRSFGAVALGR
ncbi:hypothetical protein [Iodidimonas sp. SYSU 1G8]|uniref:hypothetical protein n=1 Tax=Iodidimonas sp. SYSU 1G8 TaxID=3133967 RepID=UPI0031FE8FD7